MVVVRLAEAKIALSPKKIITRSLGSCVGIIMFDSYNKIGGLAHVVNPFCSNNISKKERYANTAVPYLLEEMIKYGAKKENISSGIFGGSSMFENIYSNSFLRIGERNVEVSKDELLKLKIPIKFEHTRGNTQRTVELDCSTGIISLIIGSKENLHFNFKK